MTDFGLTEDMYGTNYFCYDENVVGSEEKDPIKWMAPAKIGPPPPDHLQQP